MSVESPREWRMSEQSGAARGRPALDPVGAASLRRYAAGVGNPELARALTEIAAHGYPDPATGVAWEVLREARLAAARPANEPDVPGDSGGSAVEPRDT
ncbi:hypothetical protein ACN20G_28375 (plasmid) [Streptomyces sp. BI20]|uniref:hypothetical protein n=1 Tax=Streptomyces sp. BI20 TaxID=3403460 RepID=UPI003C73F139